MTPAGDILLFDIGKRLFRLDINSVECVMEAEDVFFMPGLRPPVMGVVTYRGEPVTVVNVKEISGDTGTFEKPYIIIIAGDGKKTVGLCVGGKKPTFARSGEENRSAGGIKNTEVNGAPAELLNWMELYDETRKILSRPA
ncbi:MAG: chemotaxis protein CheW [Thermodesulfobacteriota bacterium]